MHYIDVGSGFPLLLGHSYLFDGRIWLTQVAELAKSHRVIIPDLWGHGHSPELPEECRSMTDIANDNLRLMDRLGIKEFGIIGLSVGGMWGAELAALYPERVKLIVLMGTFLGPEPEEQRLRYLALLNEVDQLGAIKPPVLEYVVKQFYSDDASDLLLSNMITQLRSIPETRIRHSIVPLGRMIFDRPDKLRLLEKILVPSLVITGEFDKPRPPSEGNVMAGKLGCEHFIIPGAGHISVQEKPKRVIKMLLRFLKKNIDLQRMGYK
ncbi:alpha/beta fold hydrolase [Citrobacter portucalensis]|uniref:Alpha/beta fold hydrolase n=1 Tax=Citrobacter portucalensis TaxID=1639133 RepID=A0AAW5WG71_9ENTR|nr:alpha/beta fold hydrolase [Citrobacter portucalensis]MCX9004394.1 alpha/beta fold hydrolase [Citrobacter portucalensis]MCX9059200.1 alpha/beta fold hydrolase [Citrobacter portucalensis]